jgi:hypothetical protein
MAISAKATIPLGGIAPSAEVCKYIKNAVDANSPKYTRPNWSCVAYLVPSCPAKSIKVATARKIAAVNNCAAPVVDERIGSSTLVSAIIAQTIRP